ncbi:MAG: hypothetical protein ABSA49_00645 [Rhizomicrobium sp.]
MATADSTTRTGRKAFALIYAAILIAGALFAISGIVIGTERFKQEAAEHGSDWFQFAGWFVMSHTGTGIALLVLTLAYAALHLRYGFRLAVPFIYLLSYGFCGLAFFVVLLSAGKEGALGGGLGAALWSSLTVLFPVSLILAAALFWSVRSSRRL